MIAPRLGCFQRMLTGMAQTQYRTTATNTRRGNRSGFAEHDDFEGTNKLSLTSKCIYDGWFRVPGGRWWDGGSVLMEDHITNDGHAKVAKYDGDTSVTRKSPEPVPGALQTLSLRQFVQVSSGKAPCFRLTFMERTRSRRRGGTRVA